MGYSAECIYRPAHQSVDRNTRSRSPSHIPQKKCTACTMLLQLANPYLPLFAVGLGLLDALYPSPFFFFPFSISLFTCLYLLLFSAHAVHERAPGKRRPKPNQDVGAIVDSLDARKRTKKKGKGGGGGSSANANNVPKKKKAAAPASRRVSSRRSGRRGGDGAAEADEDGEDAEVKKEEKEDDAEDGDADGDAADDDDDDDDSGDGGGLSLMVEADLEDDDEVDEDWGAENPDKLAKIDVCVVPCFPHLQCPCVCYLALILLPTVAVAPIFFPFFLFFSSSSFANTPPSPPPPPP